MLNGSYQGSWCQLLPDQENAPKELNEHQSVEEWLWRIQKQVES